jgi:type IV pilus assembly protein PilF
LEEANEAIRADPEYPAAHTLRAMIYFELQQFDVAEAGFRTALRLKPNESDTHLNYGVFLCETGRDKEALRSFDLVLKDPLFAAPAGPALNAGLCAVRANDRRSAIRYFEIALRHEPKNMRALYQLAESWLKLGNLASAKIYADSLGRIADPTAETLWLSLRIEHALGDRSAQAALMNQLRRKFPDSQEYRAALQGYYE